MQQAVIASYDPFKYPPDYNLARLHKNASMPGQSINPPNSCPCCNKKQKKQFTKWLSRSIDNDFKNQGGSVVSYFWLLKLYTFVIGFILLLYGIYLTYLIQQNCSSQLPQCQKFLGLWVISNQNLIRILKKVDETAITRLLTLRGITFIILMLTNAFSLVLVKLFKKIYPSSLNISDYSLIFSNVHIKSDQLSQKIKKQFPDVQFKQILNLNSLEPFCTTYKLKLSIYYRLLSKNYKQKQIKKLEKTLAQLCSKCDEYQTDFNSCLGQRILIVCNNIDDKKKIQNKYKGKPSQSFAHLLGLNYDINDKIYCQSAPKPQEILWNNIGSPDSHKTKYKIISILNFIFLLAINYGLFFLCMQIIYQKWLNSPWDTIFINVILTLLVVAALSFRANMNKLSQMSHPSTYTNRTMFIVLTTVSFHLIFYLIIPTFYFSWAYDQHKTQILKMISNQVLNFIIFQFIIAGIDLMHYNWKKQLKFIQNEQNPFACQLIIHQQIQYPRFPIQFKLIILFKLWSFTIFFAFQSPQILLLILLTLFFLFFKDKHALYFHYRMQIIDNKVQFNFLRIYSTFFSVYMLVIFLLTQHLEIQFWLAIGFTVILIALQLGYLGRNFEDKQGALQQNGTLLLPPCFQQLQNQDSYIKLYNNFKNRIRNKQLDIEIAQYLTQIQSTTQESISKQSLNSSKRINKSQK